jgi:hypothetical protein
MKPGLRRYLAVPLLALASFGFVALSPCVAFAEDDAGDASTDAARDASTDAALADADTALADADTGRCLDGLQQETLTACASKALGAACTFASGVRGVCARLRCTDPAGAALLACVAEAAPFDAGVRDSGANAFDPDDPVPVENGYGGGGAGCGVGVVRSTDLGAAASLFGLCATFALGVVVLRRRRN